MPKATASIPLSPRKAPRQRRSAHTVSAVLEAAARILEENGWRAYTTNAVAARAGVSIGSLYQYFPNRDALTVALIERETATLLAEVAHAAPCETCAALLASLVRAAVAHQMRRPLLARFIDYEEKRLPIGERNQRVADTIHAVLVQALLKPDAPPLDDVALAAHDVLAIVHGMVDAAGERGEVDAGALEKRVARAVDGYLRGAAPSPGTRRAASMACARVSNTRG